MAFLETRGMLSKLLATENLIIEHDHKARTASFNTADRVLKLPILNTENENIYNLFCAHEVGHALQTPVEWKNDIPDGVPFDFVNVIEDVRIEKYIQNKFPGLRTDFSRGYDQLNEMDFFQIKDTDLTKLPLIDRINLFYKLGVRAFVPFTADEQPYVDAVGDADTWDKVLLVSKMISDYVDHHGDNNQQPVDVPMPSNDGETGETSNQSKVTSDKEGESDSPEGSNDDGGDNTETEETGSKAEQLPDQKVSQTQRSFDQSLEDITESNEYGTGYVYVQHGNTDVKKLITTIDDVRSSMVYPETSEFTEANRRMMNDFLKSIKPEVNHMVQQFEMKKSADAYARQQVNKTGVLDTNRLHNYKLSDDLFLRQSITPDGKCHGMVMYLDWSGSMHDIAFNTIKQIITLVQFCRKVQIPFEVYLFTSSDKEDMYEARKDMNSGDLCSSAVRLIQVLTSDAKNKQIDTDMFNLWCSAKFTSSVPYSVHMRMGGTPLDNALLIVPDIIKMFRDKTGAQKVSFVCITDGESAPVYYYETRKAYDSEYLRPSYAYMDQLMLRYNGKVTQLDNRPDSTASVVKWLDSVLEGVSITNLFLGKTAKSSDYLRNFGERLDEKVFRKNGCYVTTSESWPLLGVINPNNFGDTTDEINVDDGATKAQIKSALNKMLKTKNSSKLILTQLVHQFA
jgi:hypothetical protein